MSPPRLHVITDRGITDHPMERARAVLEAEEAVRTSLAAMARAVADLDRNPMLGWLWRR